MSFFPTHDNRCGMSALTGTNPASRGKLDMTRDLWNEQSHAAQMTLWTMSDWTESDWGALF